MNREEIMALIPHREPFLFLDEVTECEPLKRTVAIWNIDESLFCFKGHFPGRPILPGVLMAEALAQAGAVAIFMDDAFKGKLAVFGGIDKMRFRGMVTPPSKLILETELSRVSQIGGKGHGRVTLNGKTVCEGEILFAFAPEPKEDK